jgi:hypothetical protein
MLFCPKICERNVEFGLATSHLLFDESKNTIAFAASTTYFFLHSRRKDKLRALHVAK